MPNFYAFEFLCGCSDFLRRRGNLHCFTSKSQRDSWVRSCYVPIAHMGWREAIYSHEAYCLMDCHNITSYHHRPDEVYSVGQRYYYATEPRKIMRPTFEPVLVETVYAFATAEKRNEWIVEPDLLGLPDIIRMPEQHVVDQDADDILEWCVRQVPILHRRRAITADRARQLVSSNSEIPIFEPWKSFNIVH
jgi:hypothetical protein